MQRARSHRPVAVLVLLLALPLAAHLVASEGHDWPQFRGIHRDGTSAETGLLAEWAEGGPKQVWRRSLGEGYSAVSVVGGRLYTMYATDHDGKPTELAVALDASSGEELWSVSLGEKYDTEFGNGPRSTPTVDGDTVYVLGSQGELAALATADGKERWRINLTEAFGSSVPHWGFSMSTLVDGDQLVVEGGGPEGKSYVGLDKKTGKTKWSLGDAPAGYNSPLRVEMNGETRYIYVSQGKLMSIDAEGKEVWSHEWPRGETHAMPVLVPPDRVFASGAEGVGAQMLKVSESDGDTTVEQQWETRFMRNHFSSSVYLDGYLYGFDNATLKCISVEDGKMAWGKRGLGKGSLILADGNLFVLSDRGELVLVEASPEAYVEKGRVQALEGRCWTAPTLSNGRLYLRNHEELVVYDVKG